MVLKDWKIIVNKKTEFEYINKVKKIGVYGLAKLGGWVVRRYSKKAFGAKDLVVPLKPKTKAQALKYAKSYMRKH